MVISSITGAVIIAPVSVMAISLGGLQSTIASIIISLMLQAGVAPVNQSYLTALNTSYGYTIETAISEGLLTETAGTLVDTGLSSAIESASAYTDLGLSEIFTTTVEDAGVIAGSGAYNIANTAINVGTGGTIGAFAGAALIGVGAGVLANHIRDSIGKLIKYGLPVNFSDEIVNYMTLDNMVYYQARFGSSVANPIYIYSVEYENGCYVVGYKNGANGYGTILRNFTNNTLQYKRYTFTNDEQTQKVESTIKGLNNTNPGVSVGNLSGNQLLGTNIKDIFNSQNEARDYLNSLSINDIPNTYSPDVIGMYGNQTYDNTNNTYPGITNQLDDGEDMMPVSMNDYQTFANNANSNTEDGNTGQDNADLFNDLIDLLIVDAPTIPDEPIIPDSPVDVPTVPDRPIVPQQPTVPNKPDVTQEDIDEALEGVTTIDLRSVFPFCIPFDLYNIVKIFDTGENRRAPHIVYTFPGTDWTIDIDLVVYDSAAGILRLMELILFIIGLAVATRKLIGAGG